MCSLPSTQLTQTPRLGSAGVAFAESAQLTQVQIQTEEQDLEWTPEASRELSKIPGFVRAKVKKNVCQYARTKNILLITPELMYAAKENLS